MSVCDTIYGVNSVLSRDIRIRTNNSFQTTQQSNFSANLGKTRLMPQQDRKVLWPSQYLLQAELSMWAFCMFSHAPGFEKSQPRDKIFQFDGTKLGLNSRF